MMVSNIEKFDMTVVLVLAELYTRFPVREELFAGDFILTEEGERIEGMSMEKEWSLAKGDPYRQRKKFAFDCLNWLIDAGYVQGKPHDNGSIGDAVLTAKGLEVLKAIPDSLQGTLGERLQEAAKGSIGAVGSALVGQVVGFGLKLLA